MPERLDEPLRRTADGSVEAVTYAAAVMRARDPWLVLCGGCGDDVHFQSISDGICGACRLDAKAGRAVG